MRMAAICIRNLDDRVMELLRIRAVRHGRSREAEVRAILADAVRDLDEGTSLSQAIIASLRELSQGRSASWLAWLTGRPIEERSRQPGHRYLACLTRRPIIETSPRDRSRGHHGTWPNASTASPLRAGDCLTGPAASGGSSV
jgi:plasmid stability protein